MKICNICKRISGTEEDHLDCAEKIRIQFEDENFKQGIPEKLDIGKNSQNLSVEVRAILEHLSRKNENSS